MEEKVVERAERQPTTEGSMPELKLTQAVRSAEPIVKVEPNRPITPEDGIIQPYGEYTIVLANGVREMRILDREGKNVSDFDGNIRIWAIDINRLSQSRIYIRDEHIMIRMPSNRSSNAGSYITHFQTKGDKGERLSPRNWKKLDLSSYRRELADIFGDEHTTVAPDFETLIEQSMYKFDEDIEAYLRDKTI